MSFKESAMHAGAKVGKFALNGIISAVRIVSTKVKQHMRERQAFKITSQ